MKLIINVNSITFDKATEEIVINGNEVINPDVCVSEYTIENPKLVNDYLDFEGKLNFTGVVKDGDNTIAHYVDGRIHRDNEPAVEWSDGFKEWRFHGELHRKDGPAIECNIFKEWYLVGQLHRKDGPATEYADGRKCWWFDGEHYGNNDDFTNESWAAHLAKLK